MEPEQRRAFILFEVEGRTGKEVAEIARRSLPSTFRRLYEARRVLKDTLGVPAHRSDRSRRPSAQPRTTDGLCFEKTIGS